MEKYKFLPHSADIKFIAFGKDLNEAFCNCALALTNSVCDEKIKPTKEFKIISKASDLKSLLVDFLENILFYLEVDNLLVSYIKELKIIGIGGIKKRKYELRAILVGDSIKNGYELKNHIKAITYSEMEIKKEKDKYAIQVVIDV